LFDFLVPFFGIQMIQYTVQFYEFDSMLRFYDFDCVIVNVVEAKSHLNDQFQFTKKNEVCYCSNGSMLRAHVFF
jgi:hypothetical protein